jgi:adenosylmethionine-8-amino-7-oxononanoate aminotransferase
MGIAADDAELAGVAVAAVLIEPMLQGAGGMIVWPREFLFGVRRLCDCTPANPYRKSARDRQFP